MELEVLLKLRALASIGRTGLCEYQRHFWLDVFSSDFLARHLAATEYNSEVTAEQTIGVDASTLEPGRGSQLV